MPADTHSFFGTRLPALSYWQRFGIALVAGALAPLGLAPLGLWPLSILAPAVLALLTWQQSIKQSYQTAFAFGLGFFGVGVSWVYVSIHDFGHAPVWLAACLTGLFVGFLALLFALPLCIANWRNAQRSISQHLVAFCALWVLGEWLRSWLLTGFPWLYIGYSQWQTPLAGLAPIGGVFTVSLATIATGTTLLYSLTNAPKARKAVALIGCICLWFAGQYARDITWTTPASEPLSVSLIQANIPQEKKWLPSFRQPTLERYRKLSDQAWSSDWLIWPEAAIPLVYHQAMPFLEELHYQALTTNTALITGVLYDDPKKRVFYNSATGLGLATGLYHKTRLVPFGEYVPLEHWLRGMIEFFNLPTSIITAGPTEQAGLQIGSHRLATAICYEIVYPDLVARSSQRRNVILTISNDAWFGASWGPLQHLEMAQMRAIETGRYVLRATNNGVSAIISPKGELVQVSEQFVQAVIQGEVTPMQGSTPFMRFGSIIVIALCVVMLIIVGLLGRVKG